MQIATYTRSASGELTRMVENWRSLSACRAYYFNLASCDGRAPREYSEPLIGQPETRARWIDGGVNGKIGVVVAVQS
jgi:hypothetical protein